jgi:two-component system heavy metal sensor histidine kinase CusS
MTTKLSLNARLTLLFVGGACTALLVLGWQISGVMAQRFQKQDRELLIGKMQLAQHAIEQVTSPDELTELPKRLSDALLGQNHLVVQVLGPQRYVLVATPKVDFSDALLSSPDSESASALTTWSQGAMTYRGMTHAYSTTITAMQPLVVTVAVNMWPHRLRLCLLWLAVVGAAGLIGLVGWFSIGRGLAPLRALRKQATSAADSPDPS